MPAGSLETLPPELHLYLSKFLPPSCHFSLAISSRNLWSHHRQAIRAHAALAEEYQDLVPRGTKFWDVVHDILRDPHRGEAVSTLNTVYCTAFYDDNAYSLRMIDLDLNKTPDKDLQQRVLSLVASKRFWNDIVVQNDHNTSLRWNIEYCIQAGLMDPYLAVLLTLTPFLTTFDMMSPASHDFLKVMLQRIVNGYKDASVRIPSNAGLGCWPEALPLQYLTTVTVRHFETGKDDGMDWVYLFIQLPSLLDLEGLYITTNQFEESKQVAIKMKSNIKRLEFNHSDISEPYMTKLLDAIPALERFQYWYGSRGGVSWNKKFIKALLDNASDSLKLLVIEDSPFARRNSDRTSGISLKGFRKLTRLDCSILDLVDCGSNEDWSGYDTVSGSESDDEQGHENEDNEIDGDREEEDTTMKENESPSNTRFRLVDQLPSTLKTLCLEHVFLGNIDLILSMLREDLSELPSFRRLYTDLEAPADAPLKTECEKQGIRYGNPSPRPML